MVVVVTGASGQLGQALQYIAGNYAHIDFHFASSQELDVTSKQSINDYFLKHKPDACINAAAYTAVDKAESEPEKAFAINVTGAKNVAYACKQHDVLMLHISTDFVFDGTKETPYTEDDEPNPQSVYGSTKLQGEKEVRAIVDKYYIIRTSWVYSQFGNNFMKTMLRLGSERDSLNVVSDQTGTPTNAVDLAKALIAIIKSGKGNYGIYNFSNEGKCSWYDFAAEIFKLNRIDIDLKPIPTSAYPTPAKRPGYSVLDKNKIKAVFGLEVAAWSVSLANTL